MVEKIVSTKFLLESKEGTLVCRNVNTGNVMVRPVCALEDGVDFIAISQPLSVSTEKYAALVSTRTVVMVIPNSAYATICGKGKGVTCALYRQREQLEQLVFHRQEAQLDRQKLRELREQREQIVMLRQVMLLRVRQQTRPQTVGTAQKG